jgi:hypothetical protein
MERWEEQASPAEQEELELEEALGGCWALMWKLMSTSLPFLGLLSRLSSCVRTW